uniref:peroxidase n=1 Tax=Caenorhabditis tropicalis TaxID=1561998 RepID=A0A1I7SY14_9PELO
MPLPCCRGENSHPECFEIPVPENDSLQSKNVKCLPYSRSLPVPNPKCSFGQRQQSNMATSYLDLSQIYGNTNEIANRMRLFKNGKIALRSVGGFNNQLGVPPANLDNSVCRSSSGKPCLLAGNNRINFLPTSGAMYTIWMRQHNLIAEKLSEVNPQWNDQKLFEEARRINIAQFQHVTFNEMVPVLVGKEQLRVMGIKLQNSGYDSGYDINIDSSASNVFAAAAGQFFLTLLPSKFNIEDRKFSSRSESLLKHFNDPSLIYEKGKIDGMLKFLLNAPIEKPGLHSSPLLRTAFQRKDEADSVDIIAMVIQMGRDHGLPSYFQWRKFCKLDDVNSFLALQSIFKPSVNISDFERLYETPEDIDVFVGGLSEQPSKGSLLGPTFACLFAHQMAQTKRGDRFWYENFVSPSAFTSEQIDEIRKTTMARVICDNTDTVTHVQHHAFSLPDDYGNCPLSCNSTGIIQPFDAKSFKDDEKLTTLPITKETIEKVIRLGLKQFQRYEEGEGRRISAQLADSSPSALLSHALLMAPKKESIDIARTASVLREATNILLTGNGLNKEEKLPDLDVETLQKILPQIDVGSVIGNFTPFLARDPLPKEQCLPEPLPCDHTSKYRSYSGWCNNLKNPKFGNAFTQMRRLLDPAYDDGFDTPRTRSVLGSELPSARKISNIVHSDAPKFHVKFTHMLMQFGQILDHDMMHSPISRGPRNTILNCSSCDSAETLSIHCFPIKIDADDPFFPSRHNDGRPRCMPFARSLLAQVSLGYRNQLNQLTSFLDASTIYGSTQCEANKLRLFSDGKLNFTDLGFNKEALPQGNQERDCRSILQNRQRKCFVAGDERSNEQPGLTAIHNIFLREHNRIARYLKQINNFWSDEKLFQEARRINIAQLQNIVYKEWLPVVLGCQNMEKWGLMPQTSGYFEGYDDKCDATISQEMSTSAFRFGHSLIRGVFTRMNDNFQNMTNHVNLTETFSNPSPVYDKNSGHMESILMGLIGVSSMAFDRHIVTAVRNHLFAKPGGPLTGLDLPAVNIQRARDHGVQGYNAYRKYCGLRKASTFSDLRDTMSSEAVTALETAYAHVDDIDLFPGIMSESPTRGSLVGPTLACLIGEQMQRLKKCDRFYYETNDSMVRFTPDQLVEIRKSSLSRIICDNSEYAANIQPNVFLMPDDLANSPMTCSELPEMDLNKWVERDYCLVDERVVNRGKTKRITPCVTCTCTLEGPECHSITINDCSRLLRDYSISDIQKDPVCLIQCSQQLKKL